MKEKWKLKVNYNAAGSEKYFNLINFKANFVDFNAPNNYYESFYRKFMLDRRV